ncbi:hypothetical protein NKJ46_24835 [Mesorhizobium sp. M0166]|uniref:hypothetical protein n=1 Tax=Mesorhizobium sp. M0166 TaxID=2956902 RepID=UPI003337B9AC
MDEETLTVWLDTALLMLGGFVLMTTLMMTVMNPPAKASETDGVTAPGNVTVETQWPDKLDADVDLWVQAPGDGPVGYSNKSGRVFDLLRDDLGMAQDMTDSNHEVAYSRGAPAGEYVVNVHMYRGVNVKYPVPVKIIVNAKRDSKPSAPVATTTVQLRKPNQELTALRFRLDSTGQLVPGSINSIFKPLRVAATQ